MAPARSNQTPLLLDTGPLLTYLAVLFLDSITAQKSTRDEILSDVRGGNPFAETSQERLRQAFASRSLLTTSHVVAEVLRLRKHSQLARRTKEFRRFSLDFIVRSIEEVSCSLGELRGAPDIWELIYRHGLTDAGLIFVASRRQCLVLTDESDLYRALPADPAYELHMLQNYLARDD